MSDLENKLREILGDAPIASFAFRRPETFEESKVWEAEGVAINPSSLDVVVEEAKRRHEAAKRRHPADAGTAPRSGPPAGSRRR